MEAQPNIMDLLLKYLEKESRSMNFVNETDEHGYTAYDILLNKLVKLGSSKRQSEEVDLAMINVMKCLHSLTDTGALNVSFNRKLDVEFADYKTPMQLLCSFQPLNARPISDKLHGWLAKLIELMLDIEKIDKSGMAARNRRGKDAKLSEYFPPVMLAANRGYYKVIKVLKEAEQLTDFESQNKSEQTILHLVLKAGYYSKIKICNDEQSGSNHVRTIEELFDDEKHPVTKKMIEILNQEDKYGNTALHFAKLYQDQSVARLLLQHGAKLSINKQNVINVKAKTLEAYLTKDCIVENSENNADKGIDDDNFQITVKFDLFQENNRLEYQSETRPKGQKNIDFS